MIKLQVSGRVGGDATSKSVNGQYAIQFSIAHSGYGKDSSGNRVEKTTWVRCTLWKDKDNVSQHIKKGDVLIVEGTPRVNAWLDENRNIRTSQELTVTGFEFIYSPSKQNQDSTTAAPEPQDQYRATPSTPPSTPAPAADPFAADKHADDLPF